MLDVDSFFKAAAPAATRLRHLYAINEVRMMLERSNDEKSYYWRSERWLRVGKSTTKKGDTVGPVPDGELHYDDGDIVAIEVELSTKKRDDLEAKLAALVYKRSDKLQRSDLPYHHQTYYDAVWFYVPSKTCRFQGISHLLR